MIWEKGTLPLENIWIMVRDDRLKHLVTKAYQRFHFKRLGAYILKAKKFAESAFQSQKNLRKKCINLDNRDKHALIYKKSKNAPFESKMYKDLTPRTC